MGGDGCRFWRRIHFYATFANLAFSTYAYTYGVWLMRSTGTEAGKKHSMKEYILTPVNAAIVVGVIMFIFQLRFPAPVDNAVQGMSSLTTPMAMLYVGTILTKAASKMFSVTGELMPVLL